MATIDQAMKQRPTAGDHIVSAMKDVELMRALPVVSEIQLRRVAVKPNRAQRRRRR